MTATTPIADLRTIALELRDGGADPLSRWVIDGCARVLSELQTLTADGHPVKVALLVLAWPARSEEECAAQEAAFEALRGIAQALTLELGARARINVVCADAGEREAVEAALAFLGDPDGDFLAGTTFDLRRSP